MNMDQSHKKRRIQLDSDEEEEEFGHIRQNVDDDERSEGSNPDNFDRENESDEDGEDLAENWLDDYAPAPKLDVYDSTMLADPNEEIIEDYETKMSYFHAAEAALDAQAERRRRRDDEAEDNLEDANEQEAAELAAYDDDDDDDEEDEDEIEPGGERKLNLEAFDCPLRDWISEERTRREIKRRFRKFLLSFYVGIDDVMKFEKTHEKDTPLPPHLKKLPPFYPSKIRSMCAANKSSLEVSYGHLGDVNPLLAIWLTDIPRDMIMIFDEVLKELVLKEFSNYTEIAKDVHVRIVCLPLADRLRDLRQSDLNNLIRVCGVVTRRTGVFPMLKTAYFDCSQCGSTAGPFSSASGGSGGGGGGGNNSYEMKPSICAHCQGDSFKINSGKCEYDNYQKLTLQESPGSVPAGRVPRYKDVILLGDLIDIARPGEEIDVTGIYSHGQQDFHKEKTGFPVFNTVIEANCVQKKNGANNSSLSDDDKRKLKELADDPQIGERIIRSIAPSIYGHRHVKTAVALSLFGGCAKEGGPGGTHRVRGDINVLLLGDPGTAKSQILKYAEKTAPRSVYTTGKGASAVGLTAGVRRDPMTKEWTLEGGALVLADQGVCLIDEFDKMNEQDRTSIHEAMEQQTISVSKAGIVTSLQARCAVLAAANPIGGRYDASYTLAENVELTDPILQRFDILCVLQDIVNPVEDEQLAKFVVDSHRKSHPDPQAAAYSMSRNNPDGATGAIGSNGMESAGLDHGPAPLDQITLKKYITFARNFVKPVLHDVDSEKIASLYAELRQQSAQSGGVPIAVRHIESVMRMAEASARMHLRDHVREDDVDMAIKVMLESFLQAQKISVRKSLQRNFRKYITFGEETNQLIMHQLQGLIIREEKYKKIKNNTYVSEYTEVPIHELENKAKEYNIYDLRPFYKSPLFTSHGFHVDEKSQVIVKSY